MIRPSHFRIRLVVFALFFLFAFLTSSVAQDIAAGESLFKQKCTACHAIDRVVIGPAMKGVVEKREKEWLYEWIKNSQALIASGDADAVALFAEYNESVMTAFPELSDEDIDNILAYVESAESAQNADAGANAIPLREELEDTDSLLGYLTSIDTSLWVLLSVIVFLLLLLNVLSKSGRALDRVLKKQQGEEIIEVEKESFFKRNFLRKKKRVFLVFVLVLAALGGYALDAMWYTGVQQGYQPLQPIAFSHEIHAGINQIDCRYCHGGAWSSKNASIPSLNVCMNCHNYVQATEKYGGEISPEIMKIYHALDYDPETQQYGDNPKPVEWVKIHNLPDLAYFNHSQHVAVGGLECQECHGPIETMVEVYQYAPLTMKWCIECHRETEVEYAADNEYYDRILAMHDAIKQGEKPTVAVLGGLECGKCHY